MDMKEKESENTENTDACEKGEITGMKDPSETLEVAEGKVGIEETAGQETQDVKDNVNCKNAENVQEDGELGDSPEDISDNGKNSQVETTMAEDGELDGSPDDISQNVHKSNKPVETTTEIEADDGELHDNPENVSQTVDHSNKLPVERSTAQMEVEERKLGGVSQSSDNENKPAAEPSTVETEAEEGELDDDPVDVSQSSSSEKKPSVEQTEIEAEEGELDDSDDENTNELVNDAAIADAKLGNQPATEAESIKPDEKNTNSGEIPDDVVNEVKEGVNRMEFEDDARPEEEQLDYDEDDIDENQAEKITKRTKSGALTQDALLMERTVKERSDGEVDSDSEGEIKSEDDDPAMDDYEEGETRDHPLDVPPEQKRPCRFFEMGNCTWGDRCRFLHPGINDKGNYDMFKDSPKPIDPRRMSPPELRHPPPPVFWQQHPPPFMHEPLPVAETAWEKGLRHAKELKRRAMQRKVQEPDFVQKREVLSLNVALNEDRDMEFVDHRPLVPRNRGFDPFNEVEEDEYAIPPPEELRRRMLRDRPRGPPPPHHRLPPGKDHRLPPHEIPMRMEPRPRERRPPSPHRHPPPPHGHHPMEMRRMSPHGHFEGDRERRNNLPPPREPHPGFIPPHPREQRPQDVRERHGEAMYPKDQRMDGRPPFHPDMNRENIPPDTKDRRRDVKQPDNSKDEKRSKNSTSVRGDQWSDPWARTRPQARGRKNKSVSSSSSSSSSGSSSRSSSHSSYSSRSSYTGSSRSSSRTSGSSRSSSSSHSSRSPSPTKEKQKKKVLATAKQRTAQAVQKKNVPPQAGKPQGTLAPPAKVAAPQAPLPPMKKPPPGVVGKVPPAVPPNQRPPPPKKPVTKALTKPKKRSSSSSSEFSHSDSSASQSDDAKNKTKGKSGSDSDSDSSSTSGSGSSSSSSGSSSSDSEDDKKAKPKKTGKPSVKPKAQPAKPKTVPRSLPKPPTVQQPKGKVAVPSKPGRKDVKMTIIDKPPPASGDRKRGAGEISGPPKKASASRRVELLEQLKAVEDAIARKRAKLN